MDVSGGVGDIAAAVGRAERRGAGLRRWFFARRRRRPKGRRGARRARRSRGSHAKGGRARWRDRAPSQSRVWRVLGSNARPYRRMTRAPARPALQVWGLPALLLVAFFVRLFFVGDEGFKT